MLLSHVSYPYFCTSKASKLSTCSRAAMRGAMLLSHVSSTLEPQRAPHSGVFTAGTDLRVYAHVYIHASVYAYVYIYESCASTDVCVCVYR
jgi:hypothetical protein